MHSHNNLYSTKEQTEDKTQTIDPHTALKGPLDFIYATFRSHIFIRHFSTCSIELTYACIILTLMFWVVFCSFHRGMLWVSESVVQLCSEWSSLRADSQSCRSQSPEWYMCLCLYTARSALWWWFKKCLTKRKRMMNILQINKIKPTFNQKHCLHVYSIPLDLFFLCLLPALSADQRHSHFRIQPIRFCHNPCESIMLLLSNFKAVSCSCSHISNFSLRTRCTDKYYITLLWNLLSITFSWFSFL